MLGDLALNYSLSPPYICFRERNSNENKCFFPKKYSGYIDFNEINQYSIKSQSTLK